MPSKAISGIGTKFCRWDKTASPAQWVPLAEINNIAGPGKSRETIDVTSLDSVGGYREFIAAIRSGGQVTLSMNFSREGYELMNDDFESDELQQYLIALPDADRTGLEFDGLVMELPINIQVADKITCDITIQVSGKPDVVTHNIVTEEGKPLVTTAAVESITATAAASGGNVVSEGGAPVTARGVCWSETPEPTTADDKTTNGTGEGTFLSAITGLTTATSYYVRAYATNANGTTYGNPRLFTTS